MALIGKELFIKRGQLEENQAKEAVQSEERLMRSKPIVIPDADIIDAERVASETKKRQNTYPYKPVARAKPNFDDMSATELKTFALENNIEIPKKRGAYSAKDLRTIMNKVYK